MKDFRVEITKTLITGYGKFRIGDTVTLRAYGSRYLGKISDIDEVNKRIILVQLTNMISRTVIEIEAIESINHYLSD